MPFYSLLALVKLVFRVWSLTTGLYILYIYKFCDELIFPNKLGYARAALGPADVLAEKLDLKSLGPEALDPDFDVDVLSRQLVKRKEVIKSVLLNQRILAGLGNRDTDESLWLAGIDPRRSATFLTPVELTRLHAGIVKMLTAKLPATWDTFQCSYQDRE